MKEVCSVIPSEIRGEIFTSVIDPALTIEFLAVGVQYYLVFTGKLDTHTIVCIAIGGMEVEYPQEILVLVAILRIAIPLAQTPRPCPPHATINIIPT